MPTPDALSDFPIQIGFDAGLPDNSFAVVSRRPGGATHDVVFVHLGHSTDDGVIYERDPTGPPPMSFAAGDDILARIDAAVEQLCACGCSRPVPPDGASAYFASQGCQHRWHSAQTTDPDDVYRRPDAAGFPGAPLREHAPTEPPTPRLLERELPACGDPHGAAYRRRCEHCDQQVIPRLYREEPVEVHTFGLRETLLRYPSIRQECPQCGENIPGPVYIADAWEHGRLVVLELHDDRARVQRTLTVRQLQRTSGGPDLIALTWADMERELTRFRRAWIGNIMADQQATAVCLNPNAILRIGGIC